MSGKPKEVKQNKQCQTKQTMSNKANNVKKDLTMTFKFKLHLEAIIFCNFQEKKGRRGRGIINNQQSTIKNQE